MSSSRRNRSNRNARACKQCAPTEIPISSRRCACCAVRERSASTEALVMPGIAKRQPGIRPSAYPGLQFLDSASPPASGITIVLLPGVRLRPAHNIRVRGEPDTRFRARVPDQLLDDPDARAVADHMRVHRELE